MTRITSIVSAVAMSLVVQTPAHSQSAANDSPSLTQSRDRGDASSAQKGAEQTVEACWSSWLTKEGLVEGRNQRGDDFIIVQKSMETVPRDVKPTQWLSARNAAFGRAEIDARRLVADSVATTIRSERELINKAFGVDTAPDELRKTSQALSIADKVSVLTDAALDAEIKKFKPSWNGNGLDEGQKRKELLSTVGEYRENIATHSNLFVSGAFTPIQCEGPDQEGDYTILVGLIWSPKLAKIAQSIWNTTIGVPRSTPQGSLSEQFGAFAAENPDWMAYTSGARVFTDENGEKVIVGFGSAPQTSLLSLDSSRANLAAIAAVQHFVAEQVEAQRQNETRDSRAQFADGSQTTADTGRFEEKVALRSKDIKIQGVSQVRSWRGVNPVSGAKMQVIALAWSSRWAADARQTSKAMGEIRDQMQSQGALPPSSSGTAPAIGSDNGAAVPVKAGAHSSTTDF